MTPHDNKRYGPILAQVMTSCLAPPSHYLNQCSFIIREVQWHSSKGNFTRDSSAIDKKIDLKITYLPGTNELMSSILIHSELLAYAYCRTTCWPYQACPAQKLDVWAMPPYKDYLSRHRDSHYKDKTIVRPLYHYNRNLHTGKVASLY